MRENILFVRVGRRTVPLYSNTQIDRYQRRWCWSRHRGVWSLTSRFYGLWRERKRVQLGVERKEGDVQIEFVDVMILIVDLKNERIS